MSVAEHTKYQYLPPIFRPPFRPEDTTPSPSQVILVKVWQPRQLSCPVLLSFLREYAFVKLSHDPTNSTAMTEGGAWLKIISIRRSSCGSIKRTARMSSTSFRSLLSISGGWHRKRKISKSSRRTAE